MLFRPLESVVQEYETWATSDHPRIPTGFPILDTRTDGGVAEGEMLLFISRPQVGKTTFGLNVVHHNRTVPAIFFSLEMHARYIALRLAAITANVPTETIARITREQGTSQVLRDLTLAYPKFTIIDRPAMSFKQMAQALDEAEDFWQEKTKLVVIDFLELIGGMPSLSQVESVDRATKKAKDFARERDVALVLLHQVGRGEGGAGDQALSIESARYGGEMSADYLMAAYRPALAKGIKQDEYERVNDQYYLQFLKTRGGHLIHPEGLLHKLDPQTLRIVPWGSLSLHGYAHNEQRQLND